MDSNYLGIVAVVDDDKDARDVLGGLLEAMGYQVEVYRSGIDFLAAAPFERFACMVIDQNMPSLTGLETIESLSRRGVSLPVVLIYGKRDDDVARQAANLGVMAVLEKPLSYQKLLRFVSVSVG